MACRAGLDELIARLRQGIAARSITAGFACLREHRELFESLDCEQPGAAVLLGYLAQWVDIGFDSHALIRRLLARFPKSCRARLTVGDYLHLRMAEGLVAMAGEEFEQATQHFAFVESVEEEIRESELLAVANFWVARCLRRQGRYDDALDYTVRARSLADELGFDKMAATMRLLESWLSFQKGRLQEAARILSEADAALADTDDYVSRGNIQSAYGRIARRQGSYERALDHFRRAIEEYKKLDTQHRNLARSLVNMAFVKRLIALRLQRKLDQERGSERSSAERAHLEELRREAFAELGEALAIYCKQDNHRGMGAAHVNIGFLHLDAGGLDRAGEEAAEAFRLGEEKRDFLMMARARILQSMAEEAKFEEQIEEEGDPTWHARRGHDFACDAVEYARHTQNRRLLARAHVWRGLTLSNDFYNNPEAARECCDAATALLRPEGQDYIWEDLQELKARILRKGPVDTALREWSQGLIGNKTFQQVTEEFAGILIPRVWEREDRKVSRVAERLSISPKKIRRVLRAQGLL